MSGKTNKSGCTGNCKVCRSDFGPCSLTRSGHIFKKDDETRDVADDTRDVAGGTRDVAGGTRDVADDTRDAAGNSGSMCGELPNQVKKDGCPVCHSDMHAEHAPNSGWYCVLCGYEEDENGEALI